MYDRSKKHRRWAFGFRMAGVPFIYSTHANWPTATAQALWPEDGPTVTVLPALNHVGSLSERLPPLGGIAQQSSISITLAKKTVRVRRGKTTVQVVPEGDPSRIFARLGVRSASSWGQVTGVELTPGDDTTRESVLTATASPPFRILMDREFTPPAGAAFRVHVGPEVMLATSVGGTEADIEGDTWYVHVTDRAIGGTVPRLHVARADVRDYPVIAGPEAVDWRSRRGTLLGAEIAGDGTIGAPFEIMRGFIERTPTRQRNGHLWSVELTPLSALLDQNVDQVVSATRLVRDLHWHEAGIADEVLVVEALQSSTVWNGRTRDATAAGSQLLDVDAADVALWEALFDPDLEDAHPRSGAIEVFGVGHARYGVSGTATDGGGGGPADQFTLDDGAAPLANVLTNLRLKPFTSPERVGTARRVSFDAGAGRLIRWPGDPDDATHSAVGIINDALDADSHTGAGGAWAGVRLDPGGGSPLGVRGTSASAVQVWLAQHPRPAFGALDLDRVYDPDASGSTSLVWLPIDLTGRYVTPPAANDPIPDALQGWCRVTALPNVGHRRFSIGGVARAFRQRHERWLLVEDDLDVSTGQIEIITRSGQRITARVAPATVETIVPAIGSARDGDTLYRIELLDPADVPSISEWLADDEVVIRARQPAFDRSGDFILHLLSDPSALGLAEDDIDEGSVRGVGSDPSWVRRWRVPQTAEPQSYADLIQGVARLTRSALVMRTDESGLCRMTRVPVGAEAAGRAAVTIAEGDWVSDVLPGADTDDRLINELTIRADYGPDENGDPTWRYEPADPYRSRTSQTKFQETATDAIEAAAAQDINTRSSILGRTPRSILALFDSPRRRWRGRIGTYLGLMAHLGATVDVTSRHLVAYTDDPVESELGVVYERTVDFFGEGVDLTMLHFGIKTTGWNWSMKVTAIISPTVLEVAANAFSSPTHPVTGEAWQDMSSVEIGDVVSCEPWIDGDSAVDRTITGIDRVTRRITFNAAHGLGVKGLIMPPGYASASTNARRFAYLGDASGALTGGDEAPAYG